MLHNLQCVTSSVRNKCPNSTISQHHIFIFVSHTQMYAYSPKIIQFLHNYRKLILVRLTPRYTLLVYTSYSSLFTFILLNIHFSNNTQLIPIHTQTIPPVRKPQPQSLCFMHSTHLYTLQVYITPSHIRAFNFVDCFASIIICFYNYNDTLGTTNQKQNVLSLFVCITIPLSDRQSIKICL
mgnify:FL=1